MRNILKIFVLEFLLSCSFAASAEEVKSTLAFPVPSDGDTVVFLGDSITWQNMYPQYIEAWFFRRHPEKKIRFVNLGVRGDTAAGVLERLARDLYPLHPDLVFVMLGMNDGGYRGYNVLLLRFYLAGMGEIVDLIRKNTPAKPVLISSTCMKPEDYNRRRYNRMLSRMASGLQDLAKDRQVPFLDLFDIFKAALDTAGKTTGGIRLMQDKIHPGPGGHLVIAGALLDRMDPADSRKDLEISRDASTMTWKNKKTCFSYSHPHDNIYLPPGAVRALAILNSSERFSSRKLVVKGLEKKVRLYVDKEVLGDFSPENLSGGADMDSLEKAPWVTDARLLYGLLQEKWRLTYYLWDPLDLGLDAWRQISPGQPILSKKAAFEKLERICDRIESLRVRSPRSYTLCLEELW